MLTLALQYPIEKALAVSAIGLLTVIIILAIIACLILLVSKAIRALEAAFAKKAPTGNTETAPAAPAAESVSQGQVDLVNTDEKEAAVIMAIVSDKSGIPLERLSFKSIKLLDEKKKGEK
ncbi:MAG: OadG family protein [Clostridia bacterium]|nr:OadG family protein [Clostridia bacterium]